MQMRGEVIAEQKVFSVLRDVAESYPSNLRQIQLSDVPRTAFHIGLVLDELPSVPVSQIEIADLGGGNRTVLHWLRVSWV